MYKNRYSDKHDVLNNHIAYGIGNVDAKFSDVLRLYKPAEHNDPIFMTRVESRWAIESSIIDKVIETIAETQNLKEKIWPDPWVQNIYIDTNQQSLQLGYGVRVRKNLTEHGLPKLDNNIEHIEFTFTNFDRKFKRRINASAFDVIALLNTMQFLRVDPIRAYVANVYNRRVFQDESLRINADTSIDGFSILSDNSIRKIILPNSGILEVKYLPEDVRGLEVENIVKELGGVPAPGKHYKLYNKRISNEIKNLSASRNNLFNGYEYELKIDAHDDIPFQQFVIMLYTGKIKGFAVNPLLKEPFTYDTINEYRFFHDDKVARVTYNGSLLPKLVIKDKGRFANYGVLIRKEEHEKPEPYSDLEYINSMPLIGTTRRIKKFIEVINTSSMNGYSVSVDYSTTKNGRALYQIEIEYKHSEKEHVAEMAVLDEINKLGLMILSINKNLKKSNLRKEEWVLHYG